MCLIYFKNMKYKPQLHFKLLKSREKWSLNKKNILVIPIFN